jgi:membrane protein DedA with SNARE-associated domain
MNFLLGLHGAVALGLLAGLLFVEETGVPLPFAPGELTLLVAGLLIASGGLNPYAFVSLSLVACVAGSLVGNTWARAVGNRGLSALAKRLRQQRNLARVEGRLGSAGWVAIAITRLVPGLRIYTTLVAGAVRAPRRSFIIAIVVSTMLWIGAYVTLGILVGVPVARFLNQVQNLALQAAILIVMCVGCYVGVRQIPTSSGARLVRVPGWARVILAAALDIGLVASVITGFLALSRVLGIGVSASWVEAVVALPVVGALYVIVARRTGGATVGEALLQTNYVGGRRVPLKPGAALQAIRTLVIGSADELSASAELLWALGDPARRRVVMELLDRPRTLQELASSSGAMPFEVRQASGGGSRRWA